MRTLTISQTPGVDSRDLANRFSVTEQGARSITFNADAIGTSATAVIQAKRTWHTEQVAKYLQADGTLKPGLHPFDQREARNHQRNIADLHVAEAYQRGRDAHMASQDAQRELDQVNADAAQLGAMRSKTLIKAAQEIDRRAGGDGSSVKTLGDALSIIPPDSVDSIVLAADPSAP